MYLYKHTFHCQVPNLNKTNDTGMYLLETFFKKFVIEARDLLFADQFISNLAWLLFRQSASTLHIPSWTGYHIKL